MCTPCCLFCCCCACTCLPRFSLGAIWLQKKSKPRTPPEFKGHSQKKSPSLSAASQDPHLMSSFFALLSKNPFHTPRDKMALSNILSLSQVRGIEELTGATNINTKFYQKTFSLAQVNGYSVVPSLPNGITKVLNRTSQHTQRMKTRPNPTSLR